MAIPQFIETQLEEITKLQTEENKTAETIIETKVDPPATEEKPAETKVDTPTFDFKAIDERISSSEDIKKYLTERDTYFSELEEAKTKLSQYNGYIKPADEEVTKFNELKQSKGNVDLFLQMRNIDPQSLKEDEAVKLMWQFQDGLTAQDADRKVKILYKVGKDINALQERINESIDSDEKSRLEDELENIYMAQGELRASGKKAKEFLSTLKVESQKVPDVEKQVNEVRDSWKPHTSKFIPKDISIPYKIENPDKSITDLNVKFAVEGETVKGLQKYLDATVDYFASKGIPYDEEKAMAALPNDVKTKILGENFDVIANRMVNSAIEAERLRVKGAIYSPEKAGEKTETKGLEQDAATKLFFNTVKGIQNGATT